MVNNEEKDIDINEDMYLKKGEYLYKENGEWYVKKINFKTIPITKEDYEIENERLNNIIDNLNNIVANKIIAVLNFNGL